jgi:hypothetical protein
MNSSDRPLSGSIHNGNTEVDITLAPRVLPEIIAKTTLQIMTKRKGGESVPSLTANRVPRPR